MTTPCRVCGEEAAVHYTIASLVTNEADEYGLCEEHAPKVTPEEFYTNLLTADGQAVTG